MGTMKKEIIRIKGIATPPGPFNHVVRAGNFLFLASQLSCDLKSNKILPGNVAEQTKNALDNIKLLLESSGGKMEDIVKVAIYMKDISRFDEMNGIYREYFRQGEEPARVTIQVLSPVKSVDIEIEATAIARRPRA